MDRLWNSLSRYGDEIPLPDWHQDVLADRKARAAEDLESGAQFYESCASGVGDYFLDSILSDVVYVYAILYLRRDLLWIRKQLLE